MVEVGGSGKYEGGGWRAQVGESGLRPLASNLKPPEAPQPSHQRVQR